MGRKKISLPRTKWHFWACGVVICGMEEIGEDGIPDSGNFGF
jgi:hypothetical protein